MSDVPKKKKYFSYLCKDCEIDFVTSFYRARIYCPSCSDSLFVEYKGSLWLERTFKYKRPWTQEEDFVVIDGVQAGYTYQEIAEAIDRTTKAVKNRAWQLKNKGLLYGG